MSRTTNVRQILTAQHTVDGQRNAKRFTCNQCGVSFSEENILTMHALTHASNQEPYACDVCGKKFMYESSLKHHTGRGTVCGSKIESNIVVQCDTKNKRSTPRLALVRAVARQSKKENKRKKGAKDYAINVPLCLDFEQHFSSTYTTNEGADAEQTKEFVQVEPIQVSVDPLLTKETDIFVKLEIDDDIANLANTYFPNEVMAKMGNETESSYPDPDEVVDEEQLSETVPLKSEITLGEYTFTISSVHEPPQPTSNKRQKRQEGDKRYRCDECGTMFPTKTKLGCHRKSHFESFTCDICGTSVSRKSYLKAHILNHIGRTSYSCDICGMKIAQKNYIKVHMAIHLNDKFSCDECGRSYRHRSSLDAHKSIHSGAVNPYACNECGRSMTSKTAFQRHMRSHSGLKYACDLCDVEFTHSASLRYHKKKHDNGTLQIFSCSKCGLKFTQKSKLRSHYRMHKGLIEKPFICGECGVSFYRKFSLNTHMEKHTRRSTG